MSSSPFIVFFAQVTNAAAPAASDTSAAQGSASGWPPFMYLLIILAMVYFALIRPQSQAKKKQEETIKGAKTGDKIVTTSGIHGVITNVKDTTVIVKVADNVKLEIEKTHIDKNHPSRFRRPTPEKAVTAKVSLKFIPRHVLSPSFSRLLDSSDFSSGIWPPKTPPAAAPPVWPRSLASLLTCGLALWPVNHKMPITPGARSPGRHGVSGPGAGQSRSLTRWSRRFRSFASGSIFWVRAKSAFYPREKTG